MRQVEVLNLSSPLTSRLWVGYCSSFICRLRGLMFRRKLSKDEGLLLVQSGDSYLSVAIHMLGMWTDLTLVWVDSAGKVVDRCMAHPWHIVYIPQKPAKYVLEINPSRFNEFNVGDEVSFEKLFPA